MAAGALCSVGGGVYMVGLVGVGKYRRGGGSFVADGAWVHRGGVTVGPSLALSRP